MAATVEVIVEAKDNFSGVLGNFGSIITGVESAVRLVGDAFRVFTDFAKEGLDAIANYERLSVTFASLAASQLLMSGGAKDMSEAYALTNGIGKELLDWSQQLAIHSPFTQQGVATAFQMAMAYGFNVDESKRLSEAMINFAAGTGNTEFAMERIARALGQISAAGKLTAQDINQLVAVGVPVNQILAAHFNTTTQAIMDMRKEGLIPAEEAIEAITLWMETNFAGAADKFTQSWAGLLGTFQDLKAMGLREFFGGLFEALQPVAIELSNFLQGVGLEQLAKWGDALGAFVAPFAAAAAAFFVSVGAGDNPLTVILTTLEGVSNPKYVGIANFLLGIVESAQKFFDLAKTDGWGVAFSTLFDTIVSTLSVKVAEWINKLIVLISLSDFTPLGTAVAAVLTTTLEGMGTIIEKVDWGPAGLALKGAFDEMFAGAMGSGTPWDIKFQATEENIDAFWASFFTLDTTSKFARWFTDVFTIPLGTALWDAVEWGATHLNVLDRIGTWIGDGIVNGIESYMGVSNWDGVMTGIKDGLARALTGYTTWDQFAEDFWISFDKVIAFFKLKLGISSPSTVFADIGKNIMQGLINGILGMFGTVLTIITGVVALLLAPFKPILDLLGIDISGLTSGTSASGLGTASGGVAGTGTTSGGGVVNNYYGAVYFMGGSEPGSYYDCPSPNPLVAMSGNQLVVTGF